LNLRRSQNLIPHYIKTARYFTISISSGENVRPIARSSPPCCAEMACRMRRLSEMFGRKCRSSRSSENGRKVNHCRSVSPLTIPTQPNKPQIGRIGRDRTADTRVKPIVRIMAEASSSFPKEVVSRMMLMPDALQKFARRPSQWRIISSLPKSHKGAKQSNRNMYTSLSRQSLAGCYKSNRRGQPRSACGLKSLLITNHKRFPP
jgi:hypothetical protein